MKKVRPQDQQEIATDQERRKLFLRYLNRGWLILGIVTLASSPFFPELRSQFIYLAVIIFPTYLLVRFLNLSGRTRLAGVVFTLTVNFGFYGLFLLLVLEQGAGEAFQTQSTVWLLMGLAVLFAGAFVDKWAALGVALFDTVLLIGTRLALAPESDPRPSAVVFWWMMAGIIWLYESTLQQALAQAWTEVAARKRANEQLRKLSSAVEHSPASIVITDPTGAIEYVNPRFTEITGYTLEEAVGKNPRILKSGLTPKDQYANLWETIVSGKEWRGELCNRKKNGELYWESISISPVTDEVGHITHFVAVKEDITERKTVEQLTSQYLRRLERSEQEAGLGSWEFDVATGESWWSRQMYRMFGFEESSTSPGFDEFLPRAHPDDRRLLQDALNSMLAGKDLTPREFRTDPDLAPVRTLFPTFKIERDAQGKAVKYTGTLLDITERKRVEERLRESEERYRLLAATLELQIAARTRELAEANARLTELDHLKSKFVSDVSHELRTPIANLKLYIDLLTHGRPEKYTQYITVLEQQIKRVVALVDDILDLSRLEQRKERGGAFQAVALNEVVEQVVAALQPRAEAAGLQLTCELARNLPPAYGDANQLAQVITNLVANALNYTQAGYVRISTRAQSDQVCLCVTDSGSGIDPEDLPHLFERFYRGQRVIKNDVPGTGLGLAIVKEIVDLHAGRIEVDSRPGQGTTFTVQLKAA